MLTAFLIFAIISFRRKSVPLKFATLAFAVLYLGFAKSHLISITNIFSVLDWNLPVFKYNLAWYLFAGFTVVSTILWGRLYCGRVCAFGALTQLMDATLPARLRVNGSARPRTARRVDQVRPARRHHRLLPDDERHDDLPLRRTVLDVRAVRDDADVDRPGRVADRDRLRPQSVLPVPLPGRRHARPAVVSHGVSHQALVGVQHLQDLPESVRVGRDRRPAHPGHRVRPLRRLRAPVCTTRPSVRTGVSSPTGRRR